MLFAVLLFTPIAQAEPEIKVVINYYDVSGTSGRELKYQMKKLGPKGFWAYARWNVRWSSDCDLSVLITYTYPRLKNPSEVPTGVQINWQLMMEKLVLHEEGHGQHGINAATEIEQAGCKGSVKIVKRWAAQDKSYDAETRHGRTQGIYLAD
ncbi:MAG: putative secreted Zn-dependent protease [Paracoccaceae bacterium]|jgi:predicted secreted Zn-dependent protease